MAKKTLMVLFFALFLFVSVAYAQNSNLNQLTSSNIFGGMWYHNDTTGTAVSFAQVETFYPLWFMYSTHDNGVTAQTGWLSKSNLTPLYNGIYQACYMASGSGQNNHKYATSISINGINQENCENYHQMAAGGDIITQSGCCFINLTAGDKVSVVTADYTGTGTGYYYSGNLNIVRIGNLNNNLETFIYSDNFCLSDGTCFANTGGGLKLFSWYEALLILALVVLIFGFTKRDYTITALGSIGFAIVGIYIVLNGYGAIRNWVTQAIGLIILGIGIYVLIRGGYELYKDM